jgi:hypothetical protein
VVLGKSEVSKDMRARLKLFLAMAVAAWGFVPFSASDASAAASEGRPDFSGTWRHGTLPWLILPASGPGPVTNRSRRPDDGTSNYSELVGDYTNPILQPWAAEVVKKKGEESLAGLVFPSPSNQCWPEPVPYLFKHMAMQMLMLEQGGKLAMIFNEDHEVRWVRMNDSHPKDVKPSWHGDAVGHYEGGTLVIDTVGIKADRPYAMIDLFGTPYTGKLHVVERYSLLDYDEVKDDLERQKKENWRPGGPVNTNYADKYLKIEFLIEDEGAYTTPWKANMVYQRDRLEWQEQVCAENPFSFHADKEIGVPQAAKPDF